MKLADFKVKYAQEEEKRKKRVEKELAAAEAKRTRRENGEEPEVEVITGEVIDDADLTEEEFALQQLFVAHSLMTAAIKYFEFYGDADMTGALITTSDQKLMREMGAEMNEFLHNLELEGLLGEAGGA